MKCFIAVCYLFAAVNLFGQVSFTVTYVEPEQDKAQVKRLAESTLAMYGEVLESLGGGNTKFEIVASAYDGGWSLVVRLKENTDVSAAVALPGLEGMEQPLFALAANIVKAGDTEFYYPPVQPELRYRVEISSVVRAILPEYAETAAPSGIDVQGSRIYLAMGMAALEVDPLFRFVREYGRDLRERNSYVHAYDIAASPAGTVYLKASQGRRVYKYLPDTEAGQSLRINFDGYGPFTVLDDGTALVADLQNKRSMIVGGNRALTEAIDFDLFNQSTYIYDIQEGPSGTIWTLDLGSGGLIKVYDKAGKLLRVILPLQSDASASWQQIVPLEDGSFYLLGSGRYAQFDPIGIPLWNTNMLNEEESFPISAKIGADENGNIYIASLMSKELIRVTNPLIYQPVDKVWDQGTLLDKLSGIDPYSMTEAEILSLGEMLEEEAAYEVASYLYGYYLEADPYSAKVQARLTFTKAVTVLKIARSYASKAMRDLELFGSANAETNYQNALKYYEQASGLGIASASVEKERFQTEFLTRSQRNYDDILEVAVEMPALFPALIQSYEQNPPGRVTIKNLGKSAMQLDQVSFSLGAQYSDGASIQEIDQVLDPNEEITIPLRISLSPASLKLQEDLRVQSSFVLNYIQGGEEVKIEKTVPVVIHRRSALIWDDTAKLAAFITTNDPQVVDVSLGASAVLSAEQPKVLARLYAIFSLLSERGFSYIEDPQTPVSDIFGSDSVVDTVRIPRRTLILASGDCDDSTALLAALLEAAGLETALLTSPGHIYMAVNLEEPLSNAWLYQALGYGVIDFKGSLWLPIETTLIGEGLDAALKEAAKLYASHPEELLPVRIAQETYGPLPLQTVSEQIIPVLESEKSMLREGFKVFHQGFIQAAEKQLLTAAEKGELRAALRIAAAYGNFGEHDKALRLLEPLKAGNSDSVPLLMTLANLYGLKKDYAQAEILLRLLAQKRPNSVTIKIALAQVLYERGRLDEAASLFQELRDDDVSLPSRYSYLANDAAKRGAGRAEAAFSVFYWPSEDDLP
jgi:tetratricopeptide (TPR) repeat protein